ncbi:MAG: phosphate ABC transporter permease subunit PstC [Candidatus Hadarchaeales archaeon]
MRRRDSCRSREKTRGRPFFFPSGITKRVFSGKTVTGLFATFSIFFVFLIFIFVFTQSIPVFTNIGVTNFILNHKWLPTAHPPSFGIAPMILGSLLVTSLALAVSVPLALFGAIYISEIASSKVRDLLKTTVEVLSAIPSVVYGFFGLVVLVPFIQRFFGLPTGQTALTAGLVLAFMILPTMLSIIEDSLRAVPNEYREASFALGATKWETIKNAVIPAASSGIVGGVLLGLGRAIGETIAVMMLSGGAAVIPTSIFSPVRTMPATIAIEMGEVSFGSLHYSALFGIGLVLFAITFAVNFIANWIISRKVRRVAR